MHILQDWSSSYAGKTREGTAPVLISYILKGSSYKNTITRMWFLACYGRKVLPDARNSTESESGTGKISLPEGGLKFEEVP